jgi:hypothetical protein
MRHDCIECHNLLGEQLDTFLYQLIEEMSRSESVDSEMHTMSMTLCMRIVKLEEIQGGDNFRVEFTDCGNLRESWLASAAELEYSETVPKCIAISFTLGHNIEDLVT